MAYGRYFSQMDGFAIEADQPDGIAPGSVRPLPQHATLLNMYPGQRILRSRGSTFTSLVTSAKGMDSAIAGEARAQGLGRFYASVRPEQPFDIGEKVIQAPLANRRLGRPPAFIKDAAQENRKLSAEMDRVLGSNAVAQRMQARPKRRVGVPPVVCLQLGHDDPEPMVGLVDCPVKRVQPGSAHLLALAIALQHDTSNRGATWI